MLHINADRINQALHDGANATVGTLDRVLAKSRALQRLTLEETAVLLAADDPAAVARIYAAAAQVKDTIYGRRVVLFAPLYISNYCTNTCLYCGFKADNPLTVRKALTPAEVREQTEWLLRRGHKRILMVSGEAAPPRQTNVDYYIESVQAIYSAAVGQHKIKRVNVNCAPLSVEDFKKLKAAGIGTYQVFQETYHDATYRQMHPKGPKSDPDNRIDAVDRAFQAGIDDIGLGVLYGLYAWKFETLGLLAHIEHMEQRFKVGPHTISVPRIEPVAGASFTEHIPHPVSDADFKRLVAILRLAVPYTGMILSTRETAAMRDELVALGISQVSAESRTAPGGYSSDDNNAGQAIQFTLGDQRTLDEVIGALIQGRFIPSFCAACYRKGRTGEVFMDLAKPGTIKGKCSVNALITLKEYLDDFGSPAVKQAGYHLIDQVKQTLPAETVWQLSQFFTDIDQGKRDEFI